MNNQQKGLPLWGKIAIGCGIVAVLAIGGCVVGGYFLFKKGTAKVQEVMDKSLAEVRQSMAELATPEGLSAFYRKHPGLKERFATEADFASAMQDLPEKVGSIPVTIPGFVDLVKEGRIQVNARDTQGRKQLEVRYRNPGKAWVVGIWENDRLVDFHLE